MTGHEDSKFDINEYEVVEGAQNSSFHPDDIHKNLNEPIVREEERENMIPFEHLSRREQKRLNRRYRKAQKRSLRNDKQGDPKYSWAFFLASLFIGIGLTATVEAPLPLFMGLAVGFLFFVDPIYDKAMDFLNRL